MRVFSQVIAGICIGVVLVAGLSCREPGKGAPTASLQASQQVFQVKGVVQEVLPEKKKVRIEHETIPNYMEAMTMMFDVKDAKELAGLTPGDQVAFRMVVTDNDGWIENVQKTGRTAPVGATPDSLIRIRDLEPLNEGDIVPDYHFTNEVGQVVKFSDYRGKVLAFTFIFTRCPFPTFCPRMSTHFADAQKQLRSTPAGPTNWHFLTLSFDPEFDTPAVLQSYAKGFDADPSRWTFATGSLSNIVELADQIGLVFYRGEPDNPAALNHNLRTVILDAHGRIRKIFRDNEWKPEDLVSEVIKATQPSATQG
jgi:protein SCO1/2